MMVEARKLEGRLDPPEAPNGYVLAIGEQIIERRSFTLDAQIMDNAQVMSWEAYLSRKMSETLRGYYAAERRVEVTTSSRSTMHCRTCQCERLYGGVKPLPDNSMSRSWHENALTAPPRGG